MKRKTKNSERNLGWIMITAGWILALGLLTIFFNNILERQNNPKQQINLSKITGKKELVLERNRLGHYTASGTINGKPVTFLLDTGATLVSVPANQGPALGLIPGAYGKAITANGEIETRLTTIETLTIGPFKLNKVRAAINPGMNDNQVLLGMSALKQLEFTQSGKTLILHSPKSNQ